MRKRTLIPVVLVSVIACCSPATDPNGRLDVRPLWTTPPDANWQPVADDSTVYFKTNEHAIVAVRRSDGTRRWITQTGATTGTIYGKNAVIVGGLVVFADYSLYALDRLTGALRWKFEPRERALPGYAPGAFSIAADDSVIITGSGSGHVYAVRASTGEGIWSTALATDSSSSAIDPVVADSSVFIHVTHFTNPLTGELVALDRRSGTVRWKRTFVPVLPSASDVWSTTTHGDLVIASIEDGTIRAVDKATGIDRWTAPRLAGVGGRDDQRVLIAVGDLIIAGSTTWDVTAYDAATGAVVWQTNANQGSSISPLSTNGTTVYVVYANGVLGALDAMSGSIRWTATAPTGWFGFGPYPLATSTAVYAPSASGLVALRP